ncbi:hypothetical protein PINS_up021349 [Pythium insidiosum]|nr:hypothetical protein PINS_up021349 [Pythium insidiosum]
MFREFLQERNSVENLLFVIDALAYEDLVNTFEKEQRAFENSHQQSDTPNHEPNRWDETSRHEYCLRQAQKIFNKYIRYGSKAEICLSAAVKETLLQEIVEYPPAAQVFNDAVLLCSAELVHSHLDLFYRSHAYVQYKLAKHQADATAAVVAQARRRSVSSSNRRNSLRRLSSDESQPGSDITLNMILNSVGVNFFREFLKEEGVENTLFFYKEVEQFQLLPHGQKHYIQIKARKIFDKFVRRGGKLEIELPMDVRRDILFKLSSPSEFTFVDALKYVFTLWEHKYLPLFRRHPTFPDMIKALDASPPSPTAATTSPDTGAGAVGAITLNSSASAAPVTTSTVGASGDWIDVTKITLREFLDLEFLRSYFRRFLEKEQCVNELHFYFEISNFQQLPTSDYLSRQAKKLYNRFCDPQSREFVTLRTDLLSELEVSLNSPRPAMFNKAQDEIFSFFQSTLFPKFQQSEMYRTIQMTHNQLRAARQNAVTGEGSIDDRARSGVMANGGRPGASASSTPARTRGSVSGASSLPELPEESVSVTMILENPETRALFLFFAEEM